MAAAINLSYCTDFDSPSFGLCDLTFDQDYSLTSSVLISLFSWRRVTQEEVAGNGTSRQGWWVDSLNGRKLGSKLHLLQRRVITPSLLPTIKQYCEEALQWLIDDQICASINVTVQQNRQNPDSVQVQIQINKDDGTQHSMSFDDLWNQIK